MKRTVVSIILSLCLALSLTACGSNQGKDTASIGESSSNITVSSNIESSDKTSSAESQESSVLSMKEEEKEKKRKISLAKNVSELETWFWLEPISGMLGAQASNFDYLQYAVIDIEKKKGIVDFNGNILLPIKYDNIYLCNEGIIIDEQYYSDDLKTHEDHGGHGFNPKSYYWDIFSNKLYEASIGIYEYEEDYDKSKNATSVQCCKIKKEENPKYGEYLFESLIGKYGYQKNGKLITDLEFDSVHDFSEGLSAAKKDGLWGYINEDGKVIIDFQFDDIIKANIGHGIDFFQYVPPYDFHNGYAAVCKGENWSYIDKTGKEVTKFEYCFALPVYKNKAWVCGGEADWHVIDVK